MKDKKSGQLKGDKKYISSNGEEILQDDFPRIISNESKEGDCSVNDLPFKSGGGEGIEKYINMIIDKESLLVKHIFSSDVFGDVKVHETPKTYCWWNLFILKKC